MFYFGVSVVHNSLVLVAVVVDDIRDGKFDSFFDFEYDVVLADSWEEIFCDFWYNWCCSDIFVFDV